MPDALTPLYVRLTTDETLRLERAVSATGRTKRQLVSEAVRNHLDDEGLVVGRIALREAPGEVLTAAEAAALLRLDEAAVVGAAEDGRLPGRLVGSEWRFSRAGLLKWLAGDTGVAH